MVNFGLYVIFIVYHHFPETPPPRYTGNICLVDFYVCPSFFKRLSSRARNTYTVLSFVVNQNAECGKEGMEVLLTQVGHIQK